MLPVAVSKFFMRSDVEKQIIHARPSLRTILPVVFWQTAVFSVINLALSIGIFLWKPTVFPLVAPNIFWLQVWAVLFGIIGVILWWGLRTKHWEVLRGTMTLALFYKLLWSIALLFRIRDGGTFLIAVLFIGLAALQAVIIIYFLPPDEVKSDGSVVK